MRQDNKNFKDAPSNEWWEIDRRLIRKIGANASILYAEILQRVKFTEGSFYFSSKEIEEATGLCKNAQLRCREILRKAGLIKEKAGARVLFTIDSECYSNYEAFI